MELFFWRKGREDQADLLGLTSDTGKLKGLSAGGKEASGNIRVGWKVWDLSE